MSVKDVWVGEGIQGCERVHERHCVDREAAHEVLCRSGGLWKCTRLRRVHGPMQGRMCGDAGLGREQGVHKKCYVSWGACRWVHVISCGNDLQRWKICCPGKGHNLQLQDGRRKRLRRDLLP